MLGSTVLAATDNFTVEQAIGFDTTPPTIPTGLTATPVATSQIDLAWVASTDDYALSGYQIFRDNVQIATTTATTYSDVGLIASTTYTYYLTAFDASSNFSASSTAVSTTTLATPPPTPSSPTASSTSSYGSIAPLRLIRLEVIPAYDSVIIRYETNIHARSVIRWGRTISYELGSIAEGSWRKLHETKIVGLLPGTLYKFSIEGENSFGRKSVLTESTFVTLSQEDIFPPGNVRNLTAVESGNDIALSWINPEDEDFSYVRVVRSDSFYPSDTADGWVVYEGDGVGAIDIGMAKDGTRQYYTVFTYDAHGNISSGAVVSIRIGDDGAGPTDPIDIIDESVNPIALKLGDILFIQEGVSLPISEGRTVTIDGSKQLTISLPYNLVPEHLKTILVTLGDSSNQNKEFAFLLRINKDKSAYTALLAPLGVSGTFPVRIAIFDYTTTQIGYTYGEIVSRIMYIEHTTSAPTLFEYIYRYILILLQSYFFWFVVLLCIMTIAGWRLLRRQDV